MARACQLPSERLVLSVYLALGVVSLAFFGGRMLWEGMLSRRPLRAVFVRFLARVASLGLWAVAVWSLLLWLV